MLAGSPGQLGLSGGRAALQALQVANILPALRVNWPPSGLRVSQGVSVEENLSDAAEVALETSAEDVEDILADDEEEEEEAQPAQQVQHQRLGDPAVVCSDGERISGVASPVVVITLPATTTASHRHCSRLATATAH